MPIIPINLLWTLHCCRKQWWLGNFGALMGFPRGRCVLHTSKGDNRWNGLQGRHGELCFLLIFLNIAFLLFNFGTTAGEVSADGMAITCAVDVGRVGTWLPLVLPQWLATAAVPGLGAGLSTSSAVSSCSCWLPSRSLCSYARMRAMVSCYCWDICWVVLAAVMKS